MVSRSKISGSIYGLALGDALGAPTEFMTLQNIYRRFGRAGRMHLPDPALFTDDTQMTIRVGDALAESTNVNARDFANALREQFIDWAYVDPGRAPGMTCINAIRRLDQSPNMSWSAASMTSSKGCGANMRVAPTAFISDIDVALGAASLQAALTHGHATAITATELTALAIRLAATGTQPKNLLDRLLRHIEARRRLPRSGYRHEWLGDLAARWQNESAVIGMEYGWRDCIQALCRLQDLLETPFTRHPHDICAVLGGGGWVAEDALVLALYFAHRYQSNPVLAISEAARTSGDSDSIACITGAIVGAFVGKSAWPHSWRRRIERRSDIERVINITYAVSTAQ